MPYTRLFRSRFEGRTYRGYQGDVVTSALWAAGVRRVGRSFKYHRPRGTYSLANHDINAMFQDDGRTNLRGDVLPLEAGLDVTPAEAFVETDGRRPARVDLIFHPRRRGRYVLPALGVARTDAFGLARSKAVWRPGEVMLAYPRYFTLDELPLPMGRRYQPGGIPLASQVGESLEFVGTREYRQGDPLRKIHWRSWGRLGKPVVKEYQEEYFSRIALVLDTFVPRRPRRDERRAFEAAISVLASVADHFSRSENVVDIFAAGPDVYQVSAGRSLAYLENVLDVLACLEPCHEPPFDRVGPQLHEKLGQLTTVIAVVLDWDGEREMFLHGLRDLGVAVRTYVVHAGPTRRPWENAARSLGEITPLDPDEVDRLIAAEESS